MLEFFLPTRPCCLGSWSRLHRCERFGPSEQPTVGCAFITTFSGLHVKWIIPLHQQYYDLRIFEYWPDLSNSLWSQVWAHLSICDYFRPGAPVTACHHVYFYSVFVLFLQADARPIAFAEGEAAKRVVAQPSLACFAVSFSPETCPAYGATDRDECTIQAWV